MLGVYSICIIIEHDNNKIQIVYYNFFKLIVYYIFKYSIKIITLCCTLQLNNQYLVNFIALKKITI